MSLPEQPRLRRVESFPVSQSHGEVVFALRDPDGFAGSVVLPYTAAALVSLMDGTRTISEIQKAFREQFRQSVDVTDIEQLARDLDDRLLLDTPRFRARWKHEIEIYLNSQTRPAAHAGKAYPAESQALQAELNAIFSSDKGPGLPANSRSPGESSPELVGILSPHIDLHRGGTTYAWAYKRVIEETNADLFVILGTAHNPMRNLFSVTRKHFETPLGTVETDRQIAARLSANLAATPGGANLNLAADELAHRHEHSIEFQVVFLQYLLGDKRPFKILPVLVGSLHEYVSGGSSPSRSPEMQAFAAALRKTVASHPGRVFYISSGDLAHIGQRFGDREFLDADRLKAQADSDRDLLSTACQADAEEFFQHVARQRDASRVCGLAPTYTLLEVAQPGHGEVLKYDQAVELDGTACVSFGSVAFYR